MDVIRIKGGRSLNGTIGISGAKNAALPLMCACLLTDQNLNLARVPNLRDVASLIDVLAQLGVVADYNPVTKDLTLSARNITSPVAPYEQVRKMRASVLVLGPLLARHGVAKVSLPGGCAIGSRPVDLHIDGLVELGAQIVIENGYIVAEAKNGLKGGRIHLSFPSVGATENLLMAATLADGVTTIGNAAREPEVVDLGHCLMAMGADIDGLGTDTITIRGTKALNGCSHAIIGDRIEAGTYAAAVAMTGGELTLTGFNPAHLQSMMEPMHRAGVDMTVTGDDALHVKRVGEKLRGIDIMTEPYPGFPTDLQAQIMSMLTIATGAGMITETLFENRFMHVAELRRMGADINVQGSSALVRGVERLTGADVMATDLRASVSLILAGLVADGITTVHRIYHLDRGYDDVVGKLTSVGAQLERLKEEAA